MDNISFNVQKIKTKLEEVYQINKVDNRFIYEFLYNYWTIIASHLRNIYSLKRLVSKNSNQIICVDESLFSHIEGEQTKVLVLINIIKNDIRLEIIPYRNEVTLKSIIEKHVGIRNIVYTDSKIITSSKFWKYT